MNRAQRAQKRDISRKNTETAIVTDASERVALHVVRCLGRAGIDVAATELRDRASMCPAFESRYTVRTHVLRGPDAGEERYEDQLLRCGEEGDVLVPVCLNSLLAVVDRNQAIAARFRMLLPSLSSLLRANDKWELYKIALSIGVPVPRSWCPQDESELRQLYDKVAWPVIVKFRHDQGVYLSPAERYAKVVDTHHLLPVWSVFHGVQPHPIIQEYVRGVGYGFEALYDRNHKCVATFQHRRLVECPPEGGPSAVCESVRVPELEEYGRALLDELRWTGVAMVEFRRCMETGEFYLLEINPRFWGSIALSEAAGVNFPALYYHCARGEALEVSDYRVGVRVRLMPTYILSVMMNLRRGLGGVRAALSDLRYLLDPRVCEGLLTIDDPGGSWAYVRRALGRGGP